MPKNILHDIMTNEEKRTIRRVPLPKTRPTKTPLQDDFVIYQEADSEPEDEEAPMQAKEEGDSNVSRGVLWGAAFMFLVLLGFAVATGLSGATITVTRKTALVEVNHEFVASKGNTAKIALQTMTLTESTETVIPADTTKKVTERASGRIIIYNNYSEKPQRLVKHTRFSNPEGLVYRISESVIVPGFRKVGDKMIPGSLETAVWADSPGEDYNIGLSDFTIPGFKNDSARYTAFFARSKSPMQGGFDGVQRAPSDDALAAASQKLRNELAVKVRERSAYAVSEGFIFYDDALLVAYNQPTLKVDGADAIVKETAVATMYLISEADLEKAIAENLQLAAKDLPVDFPDLRSLRLSLNEKPTVGKVADTVRFKLTGAIRAVWQFDRDKLSESLLGKQKSELASVLFAFPTIEKVHLVVRPFWQRSFPTDPLKLKIEEADSEAYAAATPEEK